MKNKVLALLIGLTMVFASFTTAFAGNWIGLRSAGADDEVAVEKQVMNNLEMVKAGKYTAIDTAKMKKFVDSANKNIVIIDAMPQSSWDATHIPGAVCCETTMGKWMNADYKLTTAQKNALKQAVNYKSKAKAKKSKIKVITYCGFCQCDRSHFAAKYIKSLGYKNVYRYIGGGAAWEDAGYDFENAKGEVVKAKTKGGNGNWIGLRSAGKDDEVAVEKQVMNNLEMVKAGKYTAIDTAKMKKFVDSANKNIVIIDAMPQSSWDATHIPGAVCCETTMGKWMNADYKLTTAQKNALKKAVNYKSKAKAKKSKIKVITYCGFCQCDRSHFAAKYIKSLGYKNVYRYVGGGAAWEDAGYDFENAKGEVVKAKTK